MDSVDQTRTSLLAALALAVRSGPKPLTTALDLRTFLETLTTEVLARVPEAPALAALAGTAGAPSAANAFVTDADPRLVPAALTPDAVEQLVAPVGQDYFYYVLADRYELAEATGVRNVAGFAYQLVQGPNAWPVQPTLAGLSADLAQLTAADVRGGYTLGVQLRRLDAQQPAFARLRLRALPEPAPLNEA
jgi:hypothetical protein